MVEMWFVNAFTGNIQFAGSFSENTDFDEAWEIIESKYGKDCIAWLFSEGLPKFEVQPLN